MNHDIKMRLAIINMLFKYQNRRKDDLQMHKSVNRELPAYQAELDISQIDEMISFLENK